MRTLHNLIQLLLAMLWTAAAVAILPLGLIGVITFNGNIFLSAWACAVVLLAIPLLSHVIKTRIKL